MKKNYRHDELGEKRCVLCNKQLKKRIELDRPKAELCYRCFKGLPPKEEDNVKTS